MTRRHAMQKTPAMQKPQTIVVRGKKSSSISGGEVSPDMALEARDEKTNLLKR